MRRTYTRVCLWLIISDIKNIGTKNNRCKKLSEKAFLREDKKEGKRFIQDEDLTKT